MFYQDEGGMRATGEANEDLAVIYYLVRLQSFFSSVESQKKSLILPNSDEQGIIDILTPYTLVKRLEHFFKGIKNDKVSLLPSTFPSSFLELVLNQCDPGEHSTVSLRFRRKSTEIDSCSSSGRVSEGTLKV